MEKGEEKDSIVKKNKALILALDEAKKLALEKVSVILASLKSISENRY